MLLATILEPGSRYRLYFDASLEDAPLEVEFAKEGLKKIAHGRARRPMIDKSFLHSAKFFEADDASQILTFWQEGQGVAAELGGYVSYRALLALEPVG